MAQFLLGLVVSFFLTTLVGCGGSSAPSCAQGNQNGTWVGSPQSDKLTFDNLCKFTFTSVQGCLSTGTYSSPLGDTGTTQLKITVTDASAADCLATGAHSCTYLFPSPVQLTLGCDGNSLNYTKSQ